MVFGFFGVGGLVGFAGAGGDVTGAAATGAATGAAGWDVIGTLATGVGAATDG
jgi:hypothetical protein